jgi:2-polyprenyl-3-methyl-5-hydroxy-6-metoxy-1,4-benzoquinol methylase
LPLAILRCWWATVAAAIVRGVGTRHRSGMSARPLLSLFLQKARIAAARPWLRGRVLDVGSSDGALARHVTSERYVGFEPEPLTKARARAAFPSHTFVDALPAEQFDTVVALAVVEHLDDPAGIVASWVACVRPGGHLVLTTPHRSFRWAHELGGKLGLSSSDAADDHETLFTRDTLVECVRTLPIALEEYRRFLFGMNQLFVFRRT